MFLRTGGLTRGISTNKVYGSASANPYRFLLNITNRLRSTTTTINSAGAVGGLKAENHCGITTSAAAVVTTTALHDTHNLDEIKREIHEQQRRRPSGGANGLSSSTTMFASPSLLTSKREYSTSQGNNHKYNKANNSNNSKSRGASGGGGSGRSSSSGGGTGRQQQQRRATNSRKLSPYEVLNVSQSATAKEIKIAYFREAKKWHPDMNPSNQEEAKSRFQEIAAAYELLSDEKRRRLFDATGFDGTSSSASSASSSSSASAGSGFAHAEDVFRSVQDDFDVVKEALSTYIDELQEELTYAAECVGRGDWRGVYEVAKANRTLILGVVVPAMLIIRYPPLVLWLLRGGLAVGNLALAGLIRTGNLHTAARTLWHSLVRMSKERTLRAKNKRPRP